MEREEGTIGFVECVIDFQKILSFEEDFVHV